MFDVPFLDLPGLCLFKVLDILVAAGADEQSIDTSGLLRSLTVDEFGVPCGIFGLEVKVSLYAEVKANDSMTGLSDPIERSAFAFRSLYQSLYLSNMLLLLFSWWALQVRDVYPRIR